MATDVIMPALGMAQETGKIVRWLKTEGEAVQKGDPLLEVETDKATVEIEAEVAGVLANVTAGAGADIPVGETIALILVAGEAAPEPTQRTPPSTPASDGETEPAVGVPASPVAARIAAEHGIDLSEIRPTGARVQKSDVLAYLDARADGGGAAGEASYRLQPASPKARRLASGRGLDVAEIVGSGPGGAVLAADVTAVAERRTEQPEPAAGATMDVSRIWQIMAERTTQSWQTVPHFYLEREVNAGRLITWRERVQPRTAQKVTYTDLLVRLVAATLREHPRVNATWADGAIRQNQDVNVGLAVAVEDGLVVPVIHDADTLTLDELATRREDLVTRAQAGSLRPDDLAGGTFTVSNLGMFGVDAFNAIINAPQAAILAVGRIAERVVPVDGAPAVQPMMTLTLSYDHRVVDGARGAQFLDTLADLIEEPLGLLA